MQTIWHSGVGLVLWLQSLGPWLTPVMAVFSGLGTEYFYLLIMPALLWCVDARLGVRVGLIFLVSASLNNTLKFVFHAPRPFWLEPRVRTLGFEDSFGIPSGHAQNSLAVWGLLATRVRRRAVTVVAVTLILLIGLSRLVLGAHFPTDVLGGWAVAGVLLWAFNRCEAQVLTWLARRTLWQQVATAFLASLALILCSVASLELLRGWQMPTEWARNLTLATHSPHSPVPLGPGGAIRPAGALFGLASGAAWLAQRGGFDARGTATQRVLRYVVGLCGVVALWFGLDLLFPHGDNLVAYLFMYVRYALIGFWIAGGAPAAFVRWGLASTAGRRQRSPV